MPNSPRPLNENDLYLFREGTHVKLPDVFGAHFQNEQNGTQFAVWAPNARSVSVIGSFNGWNKDANLLSPVGGGVWQGLIPDVRSGAKYKYHIESKFGEYRTDKADPVGFLHDSPPGNASVVWDLA